MVIFVMKERQEDRGVYWRFVATSMGFPRVLFVWLYEKLYTPFLLFFNEIVILTSDVLAQVPGRWKEVAYILCPQIVAYYM